MLRGRGHAYLAQLRFPGLDEKTQRPANTSRWNQGWIYPLAHQLSRQLSHWECINTKFYINWVINATTGNSSILTSHYFPMLSQDKLQVLLPSSGNCVGSFPFSLHSLPILSFSYKIVLVMTVCKMSINQIPAKMKSHKLAVPTTLFSFLYLIFALWDIQHQQPTVQNSWQEVLCSKELESSSRKPACKFF